MRRAAVAQVACAVTGCALVAAPALLGYAGEPAADVHRTVGPFAAAFAVVALWPATRPVRWLTVAGGAALLAAVPLAAHPAPAVAVAVVAAAVLGALGPFAPESDDAMGGGWRSLVGGGR